MSDQTRPDIAGDDAEDSRLLEAMASDARSYIESHEWCPPIRRFRLGFGVGGVIGLFHFEFTEAIDGTDSELWVVVGDLPSAYFVYEGNENPAVALERYCELMEEWAVAARDGESVDECFPVDAEANRQNAEMLLTRISLIRSELIPESRP